MADDPILRRGVRQSLDGQDRGDASVADLLARAAGRPIWPQDRVAGSSDPGVVRKRGTPGQRDPVAGVRSLGSGCMPLEHGITAGRSPGEIAGSFRPRNEDELRSELEALLARRDDLSAAQGYELFGAAIARLQEHNRVEMLVPPAAAIAAWIDAVVPPSGEPGSGTSPGPGATVPDPGPEILALLSGPRGDVPSRALLVLDHRRPDLSELQRHELFLAARRHLVIRQAGFIIQPTRKGILDWIDRVARARARPVDAPAQGQPQSLADAPSGPGDREPDTALGDGASLVRAPELTANWEPGALPGGLTRTSRAV